MHDTPERPMLDPGPIIKQRALNLHCSATASISHESHMINVAELRHACLSCQPLQVQVNINWWWSGFCKHQQMQPQTSFIIRPHQWGLASETQRYLGCSSRRFGLLYGSVKVRSMTVESFCSTCGQRHGHSTTDKQEYVDWLHVVCCI